MWAADPDYSHDILKTASGIDLHFFYKSNLEEKYLKNWKDLQPKTAVSYTHLTLPTSDLV